MTVIVLRQEVDTCWDCQFCDSKRHYTDDWFEMAFDYFCKRNGKNIAGYVERKSEMPEVPQWCPLRES